MSSFNVRPLNSELQSIVRNELFEDDRNIYEDVESLREWIKKSAHLNSRMDDQFLLTFIRGCKHSLERAKQKLDMYYTLRTHLPEMTKGLDPLDEKLAAMIKTGHFLPLPDLETPGSPRILLLRPGAYDATKFSLEDSMKVSGMFSQLLFVEDDNLTIAGQIAIIDLANVTFAHFTQMQPAIMKKMTMLWQEGMPIRQRGIHYVNTPPGFETVFNIFKGFMNEKMRSRLSVHSSFETLYNVIPRRLMPSDYQGEGESLASLTEKWEKKLVANRDKILEEEKYGVDERKRVGRPKNAESLFGMDGTFRQLQVD